MIIRKIRSFTEKNMPWYLDQISNCTYRQFTTGFFFGKPSEEAQIYDSNTYVKEYTYLGIVGEERDGTYRIEQTVENGKMAEYRPDRVMQNSKNETIVVDFKFGKQKVEHHEQVRKYIGLLKSMGHHRVKGYLWYVYPNRIVEVIK